LFDANVIDLEHTYIAPRAVIMNPEMCYKHKDIYLTLAYNNLTQSAVNMVDNTYKSQKTNLHRVRNVYIHERFECFPFSEATHTLVYSTYPEAMKTCPVETFLSRPSLVYQHQECLNTFIPGHEDSAILSLQMEMALGSGVTYKIQHMVSFFYSGICPEKPKDLVTIRVFDGMVSRRAFYKITLNKSAPVYFKTFTDIINIYISRSTHVICNL